MAKSNEHYALPMLRASQIKVGDVIVRHDDHLGRPDEKLTVVEKFTSPKLHFRVNRDGNEYFTRPYADQLSGWGFDEIERNGVVIGRFLVKYW